MRKKVSWLIASGLMCLQMQLCANHNYNDCSTPYYDCGCECDCSAEWGIYGEYLYWTTRKCDLDYAITEGLATPPAGQGGTSNGGRVKSVEPSYDSGFRVGIFRECDCMDFGVRYTYFRSNNSANSGGSFDVDTVNPTRNTSIDGVSEITAQYNVDLDIAEIEWGYVWRNWCRASLRGYGGFRFTRLDQTFDWQHNDNGGFIFFNTNTDLNAYGIYTGLEGDYAFCDFGNCGSFGLMANVGIGAQYGHASSKFSFSSASGVVISSYKSSTDAWIGNVDLAVGAFLFRGLDFLCGDWDLAIGYEFHTYLDTPPLIRQGSGYSLFPACNATSFDGLFVRAVYGFCW